MIYLTVDKKTEEVKMISEKEIKSDVHFIVEIDEDFNDYRNGGYKGVEHKMYYKNNKLEKIPSRASNLREELAKAKTIGDIKKVINNLI